MKRLSREQKRRVQRRRANAVGVAVIAAIFAAGLIAGRISKAEVAPVGAQKADVDPLPVAQVITGAEAAEEAVTIQPVPSEDPCREDVPLSRELQAVLFRACESNQIPVHIALGLIEVESSFQEDAVSVAGCYGLCQINPKWHPANLSPAENIAYGISFLAELRNRHDGDLEAALTAYNVGHDNGTRAYATRVLEAAEKWK